MHWLTYRELNVLQFIVLSRARPLFIGCRSPRLKVRMRLDRCPRSSSCLHRTVRVVQKSRERGAADKFLHGTASRLKREMRILFGHACWLALCMHAEHRSSEEAINYKTRITSSARIVWARRVILIPAIVLLVLLVLFAARCQDACPFVGQEEEDSQNKAAYTNRGAYY